MEQNEHIYRDGTSKFKRRPLALDPDRLKIDGRSIADWLTFVQELAQEIRFFNIENETDGSWTPPLYNSLEDYQSTSAFERAKWNETVERYLEAPESVVLTERQKELLSRPHYALLLIFLKKLNLVRQDINLISRRHLDYYYKKYLNIRKRLAEPDRVFVFFQLAKGVERAVIPKDTPLDAGKDAHQRPVVYLTETELLCNRAEIAQLKSLHFSEEGRLWAATDARQVIQKREAETGFDSWATAGRAPKKEESGVLEQTPTLAKVGLVISDPVLYLAGGDRQIRLRFHFETPFELAKELFLIKISTESGWREIPSDKIELSAAKDAFLLRLDPDFPAIVPAPETTALPYPALALEINQSHMDGDSVFSRLRTLRVKSLDLEVKVGEDALENGQGLPELLLQNDDASLDDAKPFEPFGSLPRTDAGFYLSHPELCVKKIDSLRIDLTWSNLSDSLENDFIDYWKIEQDVDAPRAPDNFLQIQWRWLDGGRRIGAKGEQVMNLPAGSIIFEPSNRAHEYPEDLSEALSAPAYLEARLSSGLGHEHYDFLQAKQLRKTINAPDTYAYKAIILKPPLTPSVKSLKASYSASVSVVFDDKSAVNNSTRLKYLHPFGLEDISYKKNGEKTLSFFPSYGSFLKKEGQIAPRRAGQLLIGLRNIQAGQSLSLFFQMAEGSGDPEADSGAIHWEFLAGDRWQSFKKSSGRVLSDDTNALLGSGLVQFIIPKTASLEHELMPKSLVWLRALPTGDPQGLSSTIAIHTQAVSAVRSGAADAINEPIEKESIKRLRKAIPGVAKIFQPYSSRGGRAAEQAAQYYTRVSERLRHKNRALTPWDYERLVLEAFPEIYKVKCMTSQSPSSAGKVRLVVIPDIRGIRPYDPYEPKAPIRTLRRIEQYLEPLAPPFVRVETVNPKYDPVQVWLTVQLKTPDADVQYYQQDLEESIRRYLSPWAFDQEADIPLGGRLYPSSLILFLEQKPYVDYLQSIFIRKIDKQSNGELLITVAGLDQTDQSVQDSLKPSGPEYIWVAHPVQFVRIIPKSADPRGGIGEAIMEFTFVIG